MSSTHLQTIELCRGARAEDLSALIDGLPDDDVVRIAVLCRLCQELVVRVQALERQQQLLLDPGNRGWLNL